MIQAHKHAGAQLRVVSPGTPYPRAAEIRDYLTRLLATPQFNRASRRGQLLEYLAMHTLTGDARKVSEYAIGLDVFQKPPSFDPTIESLVRTELSRLRQRLKQYYTEDGRSDQVVIDLPPRTYAATFQFRDVAATQPFPATPQIASAAAKSTPRRWLRLGTSAILLFAAIATVVALSWSEHRKRLPMRQPIRTIVVLPFENYSPQHKDEYIANGMTEELTSDLSQSHDLQVVARTSAYMFKGKNEDVREIGRQLNVDAVLEGSLTRDGTQTRITAQLNRTVDGFHLWSHSYDTNSQNLLEVQEQVANAITLAVQQVKERGAAPQADALAKNFAAHY